METQKDYREAEDLQSGKDQGSGYYIKIIILEVSWLNS